MSQNEYPHDPFGGRPATDPDQSTPQTSGADQAASESAPGTGQAPYGAPQGGPQGYTGDAHPSAGPLPPGFSGAYDGPLSGQPVSPSDSRMWSMFAQLSAVLGYVIGAGFLGWVGPLIIFLVYKDRDRYVRYNAAESLNAAIATLIAEVVLTIVISILAVITLGIGSILFPLVWVPALLHVIFAIIGAVKANQGVWWNYPLNIRLVK